MIETSSDLLRSSSAIFGKSPEMLGNIRLAFGGKWSEIFGKSSHFI